MGITISYRLGIDTDRIFCIGYYLSLIADVISRVAPSATQWGDRGPSTTHPFILLTDEKDYQLIIAAAAMSLLGRYSVKLEKESGNGRADIIMAPNRPGIPNIVFELKKTRARTAEGMKKSADEALCQIKERRYFSGMEGRTLLYGICFRGKESAISMEETFL